MSHKEIILKAAEIALARDDRETHSLLTQRVHEALIDDTTLATHGAEVVIKPHTLNYAERYIIAYEKVN
jgi:hypothetical protein